MKRLENAILNALLDKYEKSKLSTIGTKNNRLIKLTTDDKVLSSYNLKDSYKYADDNDEIIKALTAKGFITSSFVNERFETLTLNLTKVKEIYDYLGRDNPQEETLKVKQIVNAYVPNNNFLDDFVDYVLNYLEEKNDYPHIYFTDSENLKMLLDCFKALFTLDKEMKERDFSAKYLKDSKLFESLKKKVIKIIRDFNDSEKLDDKEILANFNIVQNSSYALIKNKLVFKINEQLIDLTKLRFEFSLSDEMIACLKIIKTDIKKVITVENLTSFYSLNDEEALIIYLAGFHNHTKQELLIKIYEQYKDATYYHYGDIDAGGLAIFDNLINKTGIPFKPYKMGIADLKLAGNNLKKLTINDRKRLIKMLNSPHLQVFKETINYMLDNDVKLEQENLD